MNNIYPKVLLITHNSFNFNRNNGKTFNSLFHNWDSNSIAQLYFINEFPESDICYNYFRISDADVLKRFLSKRRSKCGMTVVNLNSESIDKSQSFSSNDLHIVSKIKKNIIFKVLRDYIWSKDVWITNDLKEWLVDFKPEVILLGVGNYEFSARVAFWISEFLNIPLCLYYGDDYFLNNKYKWGITRYWHNKVRKAHDKNVNHATKIIAIGDMMALEYRKAYNKEVVVIRTSVDIDEKCLSTIKHSNKSIIISYLGGLHLNRWKSIIELGELLRSVQLNANCEIIFNIFSMSNLSKRILTKLNEPPLNFCGSVSGKEVNEIMNNSDILVHVESFEKKYRQLTSLSISTKIPEYLSSGACILGYGPYEVASMRILSDNNIGLSITDIDSQKDKIDKLLHLITNESNRNKFAENAVKYAKDNFSREINNEKLRQVLIDALEA